MRLERSALRHYLNSTPSANTATWCLIGKDVENMSVDMGADVEKKKNILDEQSVVHKGYEPSFGVDTYYADPDDDFYDFIKGIAMGRLKGDAAKTKVLEVIIEDTSDSSHDAWQEDAIIEVTSYGGETGGISIPYTVHLAGNRVAGSVAYTNQVPAFTPA